VRAGARSPGALGTCPSIAAMFADRRDAVAIYRLSTSYGASYGFIY